jgi:VanZ family protein
MTSDSKRLTGLLGATAIAALTMAALFPTKWVPRTGLGWQVEHFLVYFVTTLVLCLAWRRPFVVAISLMTFSGLLEALQGLTPDRSPDLTAALGGAAGAISAAILVKLLLRAREAVRDHAREAG